MLQQVLRIELCRVPGHIHEETNRIFHRFQIAHVYYPNAVHSMTVSEVHLFPDSLHLAYIYPFIITRTTHIIEMIVHSIAAFVWFGVQVGKFAHISPVVVAKEQSHIFGHAHAFIVIILNFFVQSPYLRSFSYFFTRNFFNSIPLIFYYFFKQLYIGIFAHRFVTIAPHAQRNDSFVILYSFKSCFPEFLQNFFIFTVIPLA